MRHLRKVKKLGLNPAHRKAMLLNMVTSICKHGKITTTYKRAKEAQKLVDKVFTLTKRSTHSSDMKVRGMIKEKEVFKMVMKEFPHRFPERNSGYTRIVRMGHRKGDRAEMCMIGFVDVLPNRKEMESRAKLTQLAERTIAENPHQDV